MGATAAMTRGRKRKAGKREPSGRLQRDPAAETEWLVMEPVLRRRCREIGWRPSVENMRKVRGPEGGTAWGHLWLRQQITREQHDAAVWFDRLRADYLRAICAPVQKGSDMDPDNRGASLMAENERRNRAIRAAYIEAEAALRNAGRRASLAVFGLMAGGTHPHVESLRAGLDAIRAHVGTGGRK